eukprot:TRINITY_DN70616_c0_g1_i1.p1 TRINITY_DN70616_c0_g1~~TRINITY_DN70616_c0_g1_i1.p1  ORF type:complete len:477 (+),score=48.61 TRINITY_DN70616_c0_g1_i1:101-1531(+)
MGGRSKNRPSMWVPKASHASCPPPAAPQQTPGKPYSSCPEVLPEGASCKNRSAGTPSAAARSESSAEQRAPHSGLNAAASEFVPGTAPPGGVASKKCYFGICCTNSSCSFVHEVFLEWNPIVELLAADEGKLATIRMSTGVDVKADTQNHTFSFSGTVPAVRAALDVVQHAVPCQNDATCADRSCRRYHTTCYDVSSRAAAAFCQDKERLGAIKTQTGAVLIYKADEGELNVHGTQDEVYQARQYLKPVEPCRFGVKCSNSSCPYLHVIQAELPNELNDMLPSDVISSLRSWLRKAVAGKQSTSEKAADLAASHMPAVHIAKGMVLCRFNEACTNKACDYLHVKSIKVYDEVEAGRVIGKEGKTIEPMKGRSGAFIALSKCDTLWMAGSQSSVCLAEKLLREAMFNATACRFGMECTAEDCKFRHPKGHSTARARRKAKASVDCRFGRRCTVYGCTFGHPFGHSVSKARFLAEVGF